MRLAGLHGSHSVFLLSGSAPSATSLLVAAGFASRLRLHCEFVCLSRVRSGRGCRGAAATYAPSNNKRSSRASQASQVTETAPAPEASSSTSSHGRVCLRGRRHDEALGRGARAIWVQAGRGRIGGRRSVGGPASARVARGRGQGDEQARRAVPGPDAREVVRRVPVAREVQEAVVRRPQQVPGEHPPRRGAQLDEGEPHEGSREVPFHKIMATGRSDAGPRAQTHTNTHTYTRTHTHTHTSVSRRWRGQPLAIDTVWCLRLALRLASSPQKRLSARCNGVQPDSFRGNIHHHHRATPLLLRAHQRHRDSRRTTPPRIPTRSRRRPATATAHNPTSPYANATAADTQARAATKSQREREREREGDAPADHARKHSCWTSPCAASPRQAAASARRP